MRPHRVKRRRPGKTLVGLLIVALGMAVFSARMLHIGASARESAKAATSEPAPVSLQPIELGFGRGYGGDSWQVYFTEPDASVPRDEYAGGLDTVLAAAIDGARRTVDIAVFELDSDALRDAIVRAHERGVALRIVADDRHGLWNESDPHLRELSQAGLETREDGRSALMHNKFAIIDQRMVWTGSWNYTLNGSYRNNNNALMLESRRAALAYQAEFDEMFERGEFGKRSRDQGMVSFAFDGGEVSIVFAPEAEEIGPLIAEIAGARRSIRFLAFVFSLESLADAMLQAAQGDVAIEGVFEERNSLATWSQMPALHCAGANVRQDGNRYTMHHKVIIIDDHTVITGSFNFSNSAAERNDENILIIRHVDIAALYLDEWRRIWDSAEKLAPSEVSC